MNQRDHAQDLTDLLHILVDKVRWFTEESFRRAHQVVEDARNPGPAPTVQDDPQTAKKAPTKKAPTKKAPEKRA